MYKHVLCSLLIIVVLLDAAYAHSNSLSFLPKKTRRSVNEPISLDVTPTILHTKNWVNLTFSNPNPTKSDYIAVYSPADVDIEKTAPVKFKFVTTDQNYLKGGFASMSFYLINRRENYRFYLFKELPDGNRTLLGNSLAINFTNYNQPTGGRLAFTNSISEMKVTWQSQLIDTPTVSFGLEADKLDQTVVAVSQTYNRSDMCGDVAANEGWRSPGWIHSAVLQGLAPNTTYYYRFGGAGSFSDIFNFKTGSNPASDIGINILAFGDMGASELDGSGMYYQVYSAIPTIDNIKLKMEESDFILHIGDISYAVGYQSQWDTFFDLVEPISAHKPYMTCIGNHERDYPNSNSYYNRTDSGGECGVPYTRLLPMPLQQEDKQWYSFDYGNAHFLLMSTEHDFLNGSEQWNFIVNDLKNVNRTKTPWIIFSGHRPFYVNSLDDYFPSGDKPAATLLREQLEDILMEYGVHIVLGAHNHSYQRTCPVYKNKCTKGGIVHALIGMAGMNLSENPEDPTPEWSVFVAPEWGYTQIKTTVSTLSLDFYNNNGILRDTFTLQL